MKRFLIIVSMFILSITLVSCNFAEEKTYNETPERVAFMTLDVLDILNEVGFEKTGIKQMGMLFKGNVDYLNDFNKKEVIDLGSHREILYDQLTLLDPELIILGNRTTSLKNDLEKRYPNAKVYDATHGISKGDLLMTLEKNIEFLSSVFPNIKDDLYKKFEKIKKEVISIKNISENRKALMIVLSGNEKRSYGLDSRFGMIYKDFGFELADFDVTSSDAHGEVLSDERIREIDPEIIFVLDRSKTIGEDTSSSFNDLLNNTLIKETKAARNNDIYLLDGNSWYMTSGGFKSSITMVNDMKKIINS